MFESWLGKDEKENEYDKRFEALKIIFERKRVWNSVVECLLNKT